MCAGFLLGKHIQPGLGGRLPGEGILQLGRSEMNNLCWAEIAEMKFATVQASQSMARAASTVSKSCQFPPKR